VEQGDTSPQLAKVLDEVVGKRIVVIDDEEHEEKGRTKLLNFPN
jgi:hypothetical protein